MSRSLQCLVPAAGMMDATEVVRRLTASRRGVRPFADANVELLAVLAEGIAASPAAALSPELQALAFWLRPAAVQRWRQQWAALDEPGSMLAPRGLVLHFPPANVDLQFAYGWVFAMLTGNASVIRLSERRSAAATALCALLDGIHRSRPDLDLAGHTAVVAYPHNDEISGELSAAADVRVLWGGSRTVESLRRIPIPARAVELSFPDRRSLSVIRVESYLELDETTAERLAEAFYNDAYWYDQMACSSPRLVLWCGGGDAQAAAASSSFFERLAAVVAERGYRVDTAVALDKQLTACRAALDLPLRAVRSPANELAVATLAAGALPGEEFCGGGFFFERHVDDLGQVAQHMERDHQTVTHFGFSAPELRRFAESLGAAGVQRVVPIGQALDFERVWDGYDLLIAFSRRIVVR